MHMDPKMIIRGETGADASAISEVTVAAFETLEISSHTEPFIIEALRGARALTVSLVAEEAVASWDIRITTRDSGS